MALQQHGERGASEVVGEIPADGGIYALTFRIDSIDPEPQFTYVAIGYTTEDDAAESAEKTSDAWEPRWSYAFFLESGLEGVKVVGRHPDDAESQRREEESGRLWSGRCPASWAVAPMLNTTNPAAVSARFTE
ncbi:hypothetical protein OG625_07895 [Streptomyces sp. NBC_01351]|uniref:hypothetical protein n=1 Tax=Streptomyces sp. NBC_01351 TaxID=2903833 RepID=UPI002E2FAE96|nr:hypothetical protein [Streptomyces sp. NBC_01351]